MDFWTFSGFKFIFIAMFHIEFTFDHIWWLAHGYNNIGSIQLSGPFNRMLRKRCFWSQLIQNCTWGFGSSHALQHKNAITTHGNEFAWFSTLVIFILLSLYMIMEWVQWPSYWIYVKVFSFSLWIDVQRVEFDDGSMEVILNFNQTERYTEEFQSSDHSVWQFNKSPNHDGSIGFQERSVASLDLPLDQSLSNNVLDIAAEQPFLPLISSLDSPMETTPPGPFNSLDGLENSYGYSGDYRGSIDSSLTSTSNERSNGSAQNISSNMNQIVRKFVFSTSQQDSIIPFCFVLAY